MYASDATSGQHLYPQFASSQTTQPLPTAASPPSDASAPFLQSMASSPPVYDAALISQGYAYVPAQTGEHQQPEQQLPMSSASFPFLADQQYYEQQREHQQETSPKVGSPTKDVHEDYGSYSSPVYSTAEDFDSLSIKDDTLSDEEIARKLQEDEYRIAAEERQRRQMQEQQRQQQPRVTASAQRPGILDSLFGSSGSSYPSMPVARPAGIPIASSSAAPGGVKRQPVPSVGPVSTSSIPEERQPLLLQCVCSAVSGTQVLKGSCFLYRGLFRFCSPLGHGRSLVVRLHLPTILSVVAVHGSASRPGPPKIDTKSRSRPNVLQIFTNDGLVHTFFDFPDSKTFKRVNAVLGSMVGNKSRTTGAVQATPQIQAPVPHVSTTPIGSPGGAQVVLGAPTMMSMPGYQFHPQMYPAIQGQHQFHPVQQQHMQQPQQQLHQQQPQQPMAYSMMQPSASGQAPSYQVVQGAQGPIILHQTSTPTSQTMFVTLPPTGGSLPM